MAASFLRRFFGNAAGLGGLVVQRLGIAISDDYSDEASHPVLTAGSGAASASDPAGSFRLRTNGVPEYRISSAWKTSPVTGTITDPGNAGAIPVTHGGSCAIVTAGAETRTLAVPSYAGQTLALHMQTDGGDCVVTVAAAVNATGNNTVTLNDAGDTIVLVGIYTGAAYRWRVLVNDGCTLSTV